MLIYWPSKDPDEVVDYAIDWSRRIDGQDYIVDSQWVAETPAVQGSPAMGPYADSFGGKTTVVWLEGGSLGTRASFTNTVTTFAGRVLQQSVSILMEAH